MYMYLISTWTSVSTLTYQNTHPHHYWAKKMEVQSLPFVAWHIVEQFQRDPFIIPLLSGHQENECLFLVANSDTSQVTS